jgi:hypothetical protein
MITAAVAGLVVVIVVAAAVVVLFLSINIYRNLNKLKKFYCFRDK